jgi:hypothetical protein
VDKQALSSTRRGGLMRLSCYKSLDGKRLDRENYALDFNKEVRGMQWKEK